MIDRSAVNQIKKAPIEERINIIELILQSLKNDIRSKIKKTDKPTMKKFKIRKFSLGEEVHVDRVEIFSEGRF